MMNSSMRASLSIVCLCNVDQQPLQEIPYQHPLPPTPSITNPFGRGLNIRRLWVSLDDNIVPRLVYLPRQKHA